MQKTKQKPKWHLKWKLQLSCFLCWGNQMPVYLYITKLWNWPNNVIFKKWCWKTALHRSSKQILGAGIIWNVFGLTNSNASCPQISWFLMWLDTGSCIHCTHCLPATSIFLEKMGYPWTFPHAAIYASGQSGGIGFCHLGHEQGVQKCLQVLKNLHTTTSTGLVYSLLLQHCQLMLGLSRLILQHTRPLLWSSAHWVDNLWSFLHSVQGQILLQQPWSIHPQWQQDWFIMEDVLVYNLTKKQALQIQSVQLYLWMTLLSKITNHSFTHILIAMIYPAPCATHEQHYCQNTCTLTWPCQILPGPAAW